jgi:hypothetical protein
MYRRVMNDLDYALKLDNAFGYKMLSGCVFLLLVLLGYSALLP